MNKFYDDLLEGHDKIVTYTQISCSDKSNDASHIASQFFKDIVR